MDFFLPQKLSKATKHILSVLHYSKKERLKYDEVFEDSNLDEEAFRAAFRRLIDKKYIEHHAPYYRLTSRGIDIAQKLPAPTSHKVSGTTMSGVLVVIAFIVILAAIAGGGSSSTPQSAQQANNPVVEFAQNISPAADSATPAALSVAVPVPGVEYRDPMPFQVGQVVKIQTPGANVRRSPGWKNKPETDSLCKPDYGTQLTILGSPQYADGLWWWPVSVGDCRGWTAQTNKSGKIILNSLL